MRTFGLGLTSGLMAGVLLVLSPLLRVVFEGLGILLIGLSGDFPAGLLGDFSGLSLTVSLDADLLTVLPLDGACLGFIADTVFLVTAVVFGDVLVFVVTLVGERDFLGVGTLLLIGVDVALGGGIFSSF